MKHLSRKTSVILKKKCMLILPELEFSVPLFPVEELELSPPLFVDGVVESPCPIKIKETMKWYIISHSLKVFILLTY